MRRTTSNVAGSGEGPPHWAGLETLEPRVLLSTSLFAADAEAAPLSPQGDAIVSAELLPGTATANALRPFERIRPLGGLVFASRNNSGQVDQPGAAWDFEFFVQTGQTLAAVAIPQDPSAVLQVELPGLSSPHGAAAPGSAVVLPAVSIGTDGTQTLRISSDVATAFTVDVVRNAVLEARVVDTDDTNKLALDDAWIDVLGTASGRLALLGSSDPQLSDVPPPPPPPPPLPLPLPVDAVHVASRGPGGFGGQIEVYDESGALRAVLDDPVFDGGVLSDVEIGPGGHLYVSLDLGGNGIQGALVHFAPDGSLVGLIDLPPDTGLFDLLYPVGFDVLADGTFLVPKPNGSVIQHIDASGALIGLRGVLGSAPVDVAVTDEAIVYTDAFRGQQFVNTAADSFGWMSFATTSDSELFDPNLSFTGTIRSSHNPVDAQEDADFGLFVTSAGDRTLRKFDAFGNVQTVTATIGQPIGVSVASGEVLRPNPFPFGFATASVVSSPSTVEPTPDTIWSTSSLDPDADPEAVLGASTAPIYVLDDGSAERAVGLSGGGDLMWLNTFQAQSGLQTITDISLTWGKPGGTGVPAGVPTKVLLYEDPNDDGDPSDAVLLTSATTAVAEPNTNLFTNVPIAPTTVSGTFFVAALLRDQLAGEFPASLDTTTSAGRSWLVGHDMPGGLDTTNLTQNDIAPTPVDTAGLAGNWLLRADAVPSTVPEPDIDAYTLDLAGASGALIDIVLAGQSSADFRGQTLELIDIDGATVLTTATSSPLGALAPNFDLAILDFLVPADGVYTLRVVSHVPGAYAIVVTGAGPGASALGFETEPNDQTTDTLRQLDRDGALIGHLGTQAVANPLLDGGFEDGPDGTAWSASSTNFGTPICDLSCGSGNGAGPHSGNFWAWFGGINRFEHGTLEQNLSFPIGSATLSFFLQIPESSGTGQDVLNVLIDDTTIYSVTDQDAAGFATYVEVVVDAGAFADGAVHRLRFDSTVHGPGITNFFVDDVGLSANSLGGADGRRAQARAVGVAALGVDAGPSRQNTAAAPDRLIVRFDESLAWPDAEQLIANLGATFLERLPLIHAAVVEAPALSTGAAGAPALAAQWRQSESILYAEPDYELKATNTFPSDPLFASLWGMHNTGQTGGTPGADIDAPQAWTALGGFADASNVVIASIDTGVDYTHADLAANMWRNPGEVPGDGIDNDGNGYVDDVHGIDTFNNDSDPFDDNGHGTHTAGTFGAVANNGIGVAGMNWDVQIMALKFLGADGSGSVSDAIELVQYMTAIKMRAVDAANVVVSNNSWGGGGFSQALEDAIEASNDAGIMFVASAGNGGSDGIGDNNDLAPHYPSSYELDNVIAVAATDHNDSRAGFSNYGATSVDLGAPGVNILSTTPGNTYAALNGTSMASPHVAGAVAMLMAAHPNASLSEVRSAILSGVDPVPALNGITATGGRLNLNSALALIGLIGPTVERIDPGPGGVNDLNVDRITITFSEPVAAGPAQDTSNYDLLEAGPNGVFDGGAGDDVVISVAPVFDGVKTVQLTVDPNTSPLELGSYRLTISGGDGSIQDLDGNPLNGTAGPGSGFDHVHLFDVVFVIEPGSDLYALDLTAGEAVEIRTHTPFDGVLGSPLNSLNPALVVLDASGQPIASDGDGLDGKNPIVAVTAPSDGRYLVQVLAEGGNGEYVLTMGASTQDSQQESPPDPSPADVDEPFTVTVGDGAFRHVVFDDADGTRAEISLSGGSAQIVFSGDLVLDGSGRTARVVGVGRVESIEGSGAGGRLKLTIHGAGGDGLVKVDSLRLDGGARVVSAPSAVFSGSVHVGGPMRKFTAQGLVDANVVFSGDPDTTGGTNVRVSTVLNSAIDSTLGIRRFVSNRFVNDDPSSGIRAPWMGRFLIAGDASLALTLNNPRPYQAALGAVRVGAILGGTWHAPGPVGSIVTGGITEAWSGRFEGSLRKLIVGQDARRFALEAQSIGLLRVAGDLSDATINLLKPFDPNDRRSTSIRRFTVGHRVDRVVLRSASNLGQIQAGAFFDATFFAGVEGTVADDRLPSDPGAFDVLARIASVRVRGLADGGPWMRNAIFAASAMGPIVTGHAAPNGGDPYGFAALSYGRVTHRGTDGSVQHPWRGPMDASQVTLEADLVAGVLQR